MSGEITARDLKIKACKVFVCPNVKLIEEHGRALNLSICAMQLTRIIAQTYLKKTYNLQHYGSGKFLIPAFLYMGGLLAGEIKTQAEIADICKSTEGTLRHWHQRIIKDLDLKDFDDIGYRTVRIALRDLLNKNRSTSFTHSNKNHNVKVNLPVECPLCGSLFIARKGEESSGYISCYNCGAKEDVVCDI
jgi:hypothetical protein